MKNRFDCTKILVLGAGSWGTALSKILACNIDDVILYTRDSDLVKEINHNNTNSKKLAGIVLPHNVKAINNYNDVQGVKTVVIVTPVKSLNAVFSNLKRSENFDNIVLCSKGVDSDSLNFPSQTCKQYFPNANVAVLSGPNFAKEVALEKITKTQIASTNKAFTKYLQKIFKTDYFQPEISDDIVGIEVCGAIKNVIAIATGIAKGLDLGENFISSLFVSAMEEITKVVQALGGEQATVYSLAGLGDLLLTCYSLTSRNTSFGYNIAKKGQSTDLEATTVEGYYTAKSIFNIAEKLCIKMPICSYIYNVLYSDVNLCDITKVIIPQKTIRLGRTKHIDK